MFHFRKNKKKIFCIGLNKTGTTTIKRVFNDLGYKVGNQREAEFMLEDWGKKEFKKIISYCNKYDAFQDVPFSLPFTYIVLHQYFPNAKFILTVRNNSEQWYNSITTFHSKLWGNNDGIPPTNEQLKSATYIFKGRPFIANKLQFDTPPNSPYDKDSLIKYYETHRYNVKTYFRHLPAKLLEINVAKSVDYERLCHFLDKKPTRTGFPWLNKTNK